MRSSALCHKGAFFQTPLITPVLLFLLSLPVPGYSMGLDLGDGTGSLSSTSPPALTYLRHWDVAVMPNDIATNEADGTTVIVDAGYGSLEVLRPGGTHLRFLKGFKDPRAAVFLPGGTLLVAEAAIGSVKGYDSTGHVVLELGSGNGEFLGPNDVALHPGTGQVFVVDSPRNAVRVYNPDGTFSFQFGTFGYGAGELNHPLSVALEPTLNEAYVADARNRRIAVFDAGTGAWKRNFSGGGDDPGDISFPARIYIDGISRIYVVESLGGFVQMFDSAGGYIGQIGEHGVGAGRLRSPKAVAIDGFNRLLVSSYRDRKVEVWGVDAFEDPIDPEVEVEAYAVPDHINPGLPYFSVVIGGVAGAPVAIQAGSVRINGSVAPDLDYAGTDGPRFRFSTGEVLGTLLPGTTGSATLTVSGLTIEGLYFETNVVVVIVPIE